IELAKQIPADGEGAKHLIEIRVQGCDTSEEARKIANAVADSPLVKTAITGNDPNWGRIVSAAGYAGVAFCVQSLSLKLNGISLFQSGEPTAFDPAEASRSMRDNAEVSIELVVGNGAGNATVWASDLTVEYVQFNSEYTT
ncbi:MAG: bifunctional ornithine acetyltransferase/N-acetylglutamate synthase, partial [Planctomycetales bacterium]|nr:bifunctional ornithine acetyltransferase/N-acetylglutamate synthase [Planctomycetales bacterium]